MPGQTNSITVQDIIDRVREASDTVSSQFVTDAELIRYIDISYRELYDELVGAWGEDYFVKPDYVPLWITGSVNIYSLPADCKALHGIDINLGGASSDISGSIGWTTMPRRGANARNLGPAYGFYGTLYGPSALLGYRPWGLNTIKILPTPVANAQARLEYVPQPTRLTGSNDTFDGFTGWDELVVVDCVIKVLAKEESDVSVWMARKAELKQRIRSMVSRDVEGIEIAKETRAGWSPFPFRGWR